MKIYYPSYYPRFACIADRCTHNCCIGWEIDVDDETLYRYKDENGDFGDRLRKNIDFSASPPCFILREDERCPFLNAQNLCDIILTLGEDALCDICTLHPRFRNLYSDRVEMGIGLTCEAAAKLILTEAAPFSLVNGAEDNEPSEASTSDEEAFREKRTEIFSILTNRSLSLDSRKKQILALIGGDEECITPTPDTVDFCLSLERLDESYTDALNALTEHAEALTTALSEEFTIPEEQLLAYFLYRHLLPGEDNDDFSARVRLSLFLGSLCRAMFVLYQKNQPDAALKDFAEIARMVSSEIEYSEGNTMDLIDYFYRISSFADEHN